LGSAKDRTDKMSKVGIYEVSCNNQNCPAKYIGQTTRPIKKRFTEHKGCIKANQQSRSAVALHAHQRLHLNLDKYKIRLVKEVNDDKRLDAYESFFIRNCENAMNTDGGNINSNLFSII